MTRAWREWYSPFGTIWKDELTGEIISEEKMLDKINNGTEND